MIKKRCFSALFLIVLVPLLLLAIWLIMPVHAPDLAEFMPGETFMIASLSIDSRDRVVRAFIDNLLPGKGGKTKAFLKYGLPLCLPLKVAVIFSSLPGEEDIPYLFLIQSPRLVKLVKLLKALGVKMFPDYSFTIFHSTLLLSDNPSWVERTVAVYGKGKMSPGAGKVRKSFQRLRGSENIVFLADNTDFLFSRLVDQLESEIAYTLLVSSGGMEGVKGYMRVINEDRVRITLIFQYRQGNGQEGAEDDILFLTGLLRRLCRANGFVLTKRVTVEGGNLKLRWEISGLSARNFEEISEETSEEKSFAFKEEID